jgi:hypothetical protein
MRNINASGIIKTSHIKKSKIVKKDITTVTKTAGTNINTTRNQITILYNRFNKRFINTMIG